jgi:hypothetical protein
MSDGLDDWRELQESRAKAERQTWAARNIGAEILPEINWTPHVAGPTAIPYKPWGGGDPLTSWPNHPGLYGRYAPIDLDENNAHQLRQARERFPDHPGFGWGVCRHGFGLQDFGDGYMSEEIATARAKALNEGRPATDVPNIDREEIPC